MSGGGGDVDLDLISFFFLVVFVFVLFFAPPHPTEGQLLPRFVSPSGCHLDRLLFDPFPPTQPLPPMEAHLSTFQPDTCDLYACRAVIDYERACRVQLSLTGSLHHTHTQRDTRTHSRRSSNIRERQERKSNRLTSRIQIAIPRRRSMQQIVSTGSAPAQVTANQGPRSSPASPPIASPRLASR